MRFVLEIDAAEFLEDSPYMLQELLRSAISQVLQHHPYNVDVNGYEFELEDDDEQLLAKAHNEAMFDQATANDEEALVYREMMEDEARHVAMNEDPRDGWNSDYLEPCESCGFEFDAGTNDCPNCQHLRA